MQLNLQFDLPDILCEHCRQVVPQPFYVVKHMGRMTEQLPFCNQEHANAFYLEQLRKAGI